MRTPRALQGRNKRNEDQQPHHTMQADAQPNQQSNASEKRPAEDAPGNPPPKAARTSLAPTSSPPADDGGPPPRPRASPAVPVSAQRALGGRRAFVPPPGVALDPMNKATAAALAANTFTKRAVQVEEFRCYVQVFDAGKPWTPEENLWEEVLAPSHKLNIGVVIFPPVDISPSTHYKMMPFGDIEPNIWDYHGCGVSNLPAGGSLAWRFDHIVHFATDKIEASFIVVKVPGSPPPTMWNGSGQLSQRSRRLWTSRSSCAPSSSFSQTRKWTSLVGSTTPFSRASTTPGKWLPTPATPCTRPSSKTTWAFRKTI